jgi:hypothetical protein
MLHNITNLWVVNHLSNKRVYNPSSLSPNRNLLLQLSDRIFYAMMNVSYCNHIKKIKDKRYLTNFH